MQGGTTYNIIPRRVHLKGTVRTLHAAARGPRRKPRAAPPRGRAGDDDARALHMTYARMVPSLVNDDRMLEPVLATSPARWAWRDEPSMGSEDFAEFAARAPAFHLRIGSRRPWPR